MEFRKFTAGTQLYGTSEPAVDPQEPNVNFNDPNMFAVLNNKNHEDHDSLRRVLLFLACCHAIILDEKKGTYNAASPDELALVNAAK